MTTTPTAAALPQWLPDSNAPACMKCGKNFTLTTRRHHCRVCGLIFCQQCSNQKVALLPTIALRNPKKGPPSGFDLIPVAKMFRACDTCAQACDGSAGANLATSPLWSPDAAGGGGGSRAGGAASGSGASGGVAPPLAGAMLMGEPTTGPAPPATSEGRPLPQLVAPAKVPTGFAGVGMAFQMLGALKQPNDPHLSAEDNLARQADAVSSIADGGASAKIKAACDELEKFHLPEGVRGFLVREPPSRGTLAEQYGLVPYDLIIEFEGTAITATTTLGDVDKAKQRAFAESGVFVLKVYNFGTRGYRLVRIVMPPGKPQAVLGCSIIPCPFVDPSLVVGSAGAAGGADPNEQIFVKGFRKMGAMMVSNGEAWPLYAPLTADNANIYVKVWTQRGPAFVARGDYHPLYNYTTTPQPLFVEAWRKMGPALVKGGRASPYAMLPQVRVDPNAEVLVEHVDPAGGGEAVLAAGAPLSTGDEPEQDESPALAAPVDSADAPLE